ncbi:MULTISPECIES: PAAR domain-containing protein [Limnobacter]|uniref:PAAR domain-containing protein n=1 Tax=Limnobacter litoralis TaxID=481366 RepID=A0ABQ5YUY9_9BURK|nr:PAAR domain-containing protein [Limnobacter sp.]GLR27101.1 hypothetical protein GCM10007875_21920 [Limnobacter litoralis]HEX5486642.1 PAAR domain-containing protein [Limnobacter sp.]
MAARPLVDGLAQVILGDSTTHGGKVISGSPSTFFGPARIPVARVGDMTSCPLCPPHVFPIVQGHPFFTDNHMNVALHGHKTACGASLIAVAAPAPDETDFPAHYDSTQSEPETHSPLEVEFLDTDGNAPNAGENIKLQIGKTVLEGTLDGEGKTKFKKAPHGFAKAVQTKRQGDE